MSYKIILSTFLILTSSVSFANDELVSYIEDEDVIVLSAPLSGTMPKSPVAKTQEAYNLAYNDDERIALYLQTPYEKRQYVFPLIHAAPFISHKIKTHPEIIIWKNKKPTNIAPQLKEFAEKHLNNLSPNLYMFLDPDFWKDVQTEQIIQSNQLSLNTRTQITENGTDYIHPTVQQIFKLANKNPEDYFKTTLTTTDILNFTNVIADLDNYQPTQYTQDDLFSLVRDMSSIKIRRSIADPFKMFALVIEKLNEKESFESFLKQHGYSSLNEFASKADKIVKAHKSLNLVLPFAIQLNHHRYHYPIAEPTLNDLETGDDISNIDMMSRLYQTTPGDAYFIKSQENNLKSTLQSNFIKKGIIFSVD